MTTEVQWSELQRDPKKVAALADISDGVRVRRRDGVPLLLTREDRASAAGTGSRTAARALRNALAHLPPGQAAEVLREEFAWVDVLPVADRAAFAVDFVRAVEASAELGVWNLLAETITDWSETAAIHADPDLRKALTEPIDTDFGPVPNPGD